MTEVSEAATIAALVAERDEARHTITKANAAQDHLVEMAADWKARANAAESALAAANARVERLERAMRSIAANTCCDQCREAALVARAALEPPHE